MKTFLLHTGWDAHEPGRWCAWGPQYEHTMQLLGQRLQPTAEINEWQREGPDMGTAIGSKGELSFYKQLLWHSDAPCKWCNPVYVAHSKQCQGKSCWLGAKAMVCVPPGNTIVIVDVDLEELWISVWWGHTMWTMALQCLGGVLHWQMSLYGTMVLVISDFFINCMTQSCCL